MVQSAAKMATRAAKVNLRVSFSPLQILLLSVQLKKLQANIDLTFSKLIFPGKPVVLYNKPKADLIANKTLMCTLLYLHPFSSPFRVQVSPSHVE